MGELNEREKNIVNLVNQLSEYTNDETTPPGVISALIERIQEETAESIKEDMDDAEHNLDKSYVEAKLSSDIKRTITEQTTKVIGELLNGQGCGCGGHQESNSEHCCSTDNRKFLFTRVREVKVPSKAHPTDAGIDFYVPDVKAWDEDFKDKVIKYSRNADTIDLEFTDKGLIVLPNAHVAIPSGIKTIIPQGLGMMFVNKSGVATKMKLDHSACLVDSEYRDEIIMCFFNHNTEPVLIEPGMKITQGLIVPIINVEVQEVLNCVYDDMGKETDRGGGFGSSGTK